MALALEIKGKTTVAIGGTDIGITSAEDTITVEEFVGTYEVFTSESPVIPRAIVHTGRYCIVSCPLTLKDDSAINTIAKAVGATSMGQTGTIGVAVSFLSLTLTPVVSGATAYTFPKSYLTESMVVSGFSAGTEDKRLLRFKCIPDPTALQTATTAYFTTSTV